MNISKRQFFKLCCAAAIQLSLGCSNKKLIINPKRPHHTNKGYRNFPVTPEPGFPGFGFIGNRLRSIWNQPEIPENHYLTEEDAIKCFYKNKTSSSVTWIGHSTFLIRTGKRNILLDPFFSDYASPFSLGPKRYVKPGIAIKNLPKIDFMAVSHNHYDHLDSRSVEKFADKEKIKVLVPPGLKPFFTERGYKNVKELDWHQSESISDITFTSLPAVHYSGRSLTDRNRTLWCSWGIHSPETKIYFAGDTAYSPSLFKKIGEKHGGFDTAIVPIGAYKPEYVMKYVHTTPEEAVRIACDINAKTIIPSHWGTIELSDEPVFKPPERFRTEALKNGISDEKIRILKIGETI